jgi:hypothetical protein
MRCAVLACLSALAVAAAGGGCGSSSDTASVPTAPPPASRPQDFPKPGGKTVSQLVAGLPQGPQLAPAVAVLPARQADRFGFGLFDRAGKQIGGAKVALYTAAPDGTDVRGPYPVRSESLAVKPQFVSQTSADDPAAAKSVYVGRAPFPKRGKRVVFALAQLDDRLVATPPTEVEVGVGGPPEVGQKAPRITTPTVASVGGDVAKIDTRVPPGTMHDVNYADAYGKKPIVIVFATPQLCQSRVCGPIVDIVEQTKAANAGKADFIHMEIYNQNDASKGFRPQVRAFGLPTEPWIFGINRKGVVAARLEGAASAREVQQLVDKTVASGGSASS